MEVQGLDYIKINKTIGKPYALQSDAPNSFNCWTLITHLYPQAPSFEPSELKEYIELFNKEKDTLSWVEHDEPQLGDIILFAKNNYFSHAGVLVDFNKVLHASSVCVVIESLDTLKLYYQKQRYYRWQ